VSAHLPAVGEMGSDPDLTPFSWVLGNGWLDGDITSVHAQIGTNNITYACDKGRYHR
jgi:hypothetical protein